MPPCTRCHPTRMFKGKSQHTAHPWWHVRTILRDNSRKCRHFRPRATDLMHSSSSSSSRSSSSRTSCTAHPRYPWTRLSTSLSLHRMLRGHYVGHSHKLEGNVWVDTYNHQGSR